MNALRTDEKAHARLIRQQLDLEKLQAEQDLAIREAEDFQREIADLEQTIKRLQEDRLARRSPAMAAAARVADRGEAERQNELLFQMDQGQRRILILTEQRGEAEGAVVEHDREIEQLNEQILGTKPVVISR